MFTDPVDMSTPLASAVFLEIDANPVSFCEGMGYDFVTFSAGLANLQNTKNETNLLLPLGIQNLTGFQL